jgi:hypothetical protein
VIWFWGVLTPPIIGLEALNCKWEKNYQLNGNHGCHIQVYTCIYIPVYIVPQKSKYLFPNQVSHTGYGEPLFTNGNESYAYKQILLNTNIHIF